MSYLTDRQREELHRAIASYLRGRGFTESAEVFTREAQVSPTNGHNAAEPQQPSPAPSSAEDGALERKWTGVLRLQKQVIDLEKALAGASFGTTSTKADLQNWLPSNTPTHTLTGHRLPISSLAFHPTVGSVATACEAGTVRVTDYETGTHETTVTAHAKPITSIDYASLPDNGVLLATASLDMTIRIFDANDGYRGARTLYGHEDGVSAIRFFSNPAHATPNSLTGTMLDTASATVLASCSRDGSLRLWNVTTGACILVARDVHGGERVTSIAASPDGTLLLTSGHDNTARVWDVLDLARSLPSRISILADTNRGLRGICSAHTHVVETVIFAPPSAYRYLTRLSTTTTQITGATRFCATAGRDKLIGLWDITSTPSQVCVGDERLFLEGHGGWVRSLAWHPSGRFLVSCGDDGAVRFWDLATESKVKPLPPLMRVHTNLIAQIRFAADTHPSTIKHSSRIQAAPPKKKEADAKEVDLAASAYVFGSVGGDRITKVWLPR